ncbi:Mitochondrial tRNAs modification protein [Mycoemilia scoparia]|uniref:N(6)-L-threonylcarbamoyladenine synthase n=1 Tax=Mycoemilia scoparia TaxID=417184 RepID=A0A9W8A641_9FUNG|nr:Mitochondrial tRNAs modification protein [Mycoemilia scoparia]
MSRPIAFLRNLQTKRFRNSLTLNRALQNYGTNTSLPPHPRILGIESSCDDTAAAVVAGDGSILSEVIRHQHKIHEPSGGIVPGIAAEHHLINMPGVVSQAIEQSGLTIEDIDAIAVTRGPGLPASLSVCINAAKTLAAVTKKPLIGVHHMEAHALTVRMSSSVPFPFVCLLISGGHTMSLLVRDVNDYKLLGSTRDDSVGEAFDKVARMLKIPWLHGRGGGPGPALEQLALKGDPDRYQLPVPMSKRDTGQSLDFSFSGLKTAVAKYIDLGQVSLESEQDCADMAASFQYTAIKHLCSKLSKAIAAAKDVGSSPTALVVSGGVASNQQVRLRIGDTASKYGLLLVCPPPHLCTDNGVMIAWAGIERFRKGLFDPYTIEFRQRWQLEDLKDMYST